MDTALTEIADQVYAFTQPDGGWCLNNSGIVVGPSGAVVVDTAATARRADRLRESLDRLAPASGRVVVNTHHHGDHTFGNHRVGEVTIVAHELARQEMADTGLALTQLWPDVEWGDVQVTLPTVTFRDRLDLWVGERRAELIHVGPAHTTNDTVVWLPEERVLFTGDVVLSGCTPFNLMGSIAGALAAVDRLRGLGATTVVPGHGPVGGAELFDETERYLCWLTDLAAAGQGAGLSPLDAAREADLGEFATLLDSERLVGNLHRAYDERAGGPLGRALDVVPVFGEMIEFNGGRLPTCLA